MPGRTKTLAAAALLALTAAGCVRVKPYQREQHASRAMAHKDDDPEAKIDNHVEEYREGSIGGTGTGGGGCGCN